MVGLIMLIVGLVLFFSIPMASPGTMIQNPFVIIVPMLLVMIGFILFIASAIYQFVFKRK